MEAEELWCRRAALGRRGVVRGGGVSAVLAERLAGADSSRAPRQPPAYRAGPCTWHAGAQSHDRDGRHRVAHSDRAAEAGGGVADDGRQQADAQDRHDKARVAAVNVWRAATTRRSERPARAEVI